MSQPYPTSRQPRHPSSSMSRIHLYHRSLMSVEKHTCIETLCNHIPPQPHPIVQGLDTQVRFLSTGTIASVRRVQFFIVLLALDAQSESCKGRPRDIGAIEELRIATIWGYQYTMTTESTDKAAQKSNLHCTEGPFDMFRCFVYLHLHLAQAQSDELTCSC